MKLTIEEIIKWLNKRGITIVINTERLELVGGAHQKWNTLGFNGSELKELFEEAMENIMKEEGE